MSIPLLLFKSSTAFALSYTVGDSLLAILQSKVNSLPIYCLSIPIFGISLATNLCALPYLLNLPNILNLDSLIILSSYTLGYGTFLYVASETNQSFIADSILKLIEKQVFKEANINEKDRSV
jgi:hypothetical protein